jgi:hypothetical protein
MHPKIACGPIFDTRRASAFVTSKRRIGARAVADGARGTVAFAMRNAPRSAVLLGAVLAGSGAHAQSAADNAALAAQRHARHVRGVVITTVGAVVAAAGAAWLGGEIAVWLDASTRFDSLSMMIRGCGSDPSCASLHQMQSQANADQSLSAGLIGAATVVFGVGIAALAIGAMTFNHPAPADRVARRGDWTVMVGLRGASLRVEF